MKNKKTNKNHTSHIAPHTSNNNMYNVGGGASLGDPNSRGITLVALVITIIVMLILVGITISVAINGGLIDKTKEAADKTEIEADRETLISAVLGSIKNNGQIGSAEEIQKGLTDEWDITGPEGGPYTATSPNENVFTIDQKGNVELKDDSRIVVSDLVEVVRDKNNIYIYPNAEKYYPELVKEALIGFINVNANSNAEDLTEAKQILIDYPDSPFAGKKPDDISIDELVEIFGFTSQNDFMNKGGYAYALTRLGDKRTAFIETSKYGVWAVIILLSQNNPEELARAEEAVNMEPNRFLEEYIIPENEVLAGRTGESITANELASVSKDGTLNSTTADEYLKEILLGNVSSIPIETLSLSAVVTLLEDYKIELISENELYGSYGAYYFLKGGANGTYTFNVSNDKYTSEVSIEVTGI